MALYKRSALPAERLCTSRTSAPIWAAASASEVVPVSFVRTSSTPNSSHRESPARHVRPSRRPIAPSPRTMPRLLGKAARAATHRRRRARARRRRQNVRPARAAAPPRGARPACGRKAAC
eukprot:scaffold2176_cov350-Prasinococcus_capsulatus_cf.AAC.17